MSTTGAISYELFRKPCHSGLVADYKSAVPYQQKFSIASSEFLRASRLSSDNETRRRSEKKVIDVLKFNNFLQSVIDKARERAGRPTGPKQKRDFRTTLKLPFKTDHIHKKVQYLIRKYQLNTHIIYKNARLSSRVCRSALDKPLCRKFVDPQQPRRRGRPKSACVACTAGAVDCTRRNVAPPTSSAVAVMTMWVKLAEALRQGQGSTTIMHATRSEGRRWVSITGSSMPMSHCRWGRPDSPTSVCLRQSQTGQGEGFGKRSRSGTWSLISTPAVVGISCELWLPGFFIGVIAIHVKP